MKIEISDDIIKKALISNFGESAKQKEISEYSEDDIFDSLEWYIKDENGNLKK